MRKKCILVNIMEMGNIYIANNLFLIFQFAFLFIFETFQR